MPKAATACRVEACGNGRRSRGVFPDNKVADGVICHVSFVQEVKIAARHGTRSLREVDQPVHRLRQFGRSARPMAQLTRNELWIHRAGSHDTRQGRRQRTRPRAESVALGRVVRKIAQARPWQGGIRAFDDSGPLVQVSAAGIQLQQNGGTLGMSQGQEPPVSVTLNVQGSARARYIDADTGQITITGVYAQ